MLVNVSARLEVFCRYTLQNRSTRKHGRLEAFVGISPWGLGKNFVGSFILKWKKIHSFILEQIVNVQLKKFY